MLNASVFPSGDRLGQKKLDSFGLRTTGCPPGSTLFTVPTMPAAVVAARKYRRLPALSHVPNLAVALLNAVEPSSANTMKFGGHPRRRKMRRSIGIAQWLRMRADRG